MATLRDYLGQLIELENQISELTELELAPEKEEGREAAINALFADWLDAGGDFKNKALAVAGYIQEQSDLAETRKQQVKRLQELQRASENKVKRLKDYLKYNMERANITKIEGVYNVLSLRKAPPKVELYCDPLGLPPSYQRVTVEADKKALLDALKSGERIDGVSLVTDNKSLIIKGQ